MEDQSLPLCSEDARCGPLDDDVVRVHPAESQRPAWGGRAARIAFVALAGVGVVGLVAREGYRRIGGVAEVNNLDSFVEEFNAAKPFVMCPTPDTCGQQQMLSWQIPPSSLVGRVGVNLESLPGTQGSAYQQVQARWSASPPVFHGVPITLGTIAGFMQELLTSDPFGTGNSVPYVDFHGQGGKVVAVTHRQIAFIATNVLLGNKISVPDGLSEALSRCTGRGHADIIYSQLSMLAILSQEISGGRQGAMIVGTTPGAANDNFLTALGQTSKVLNSPTICQTIGQGSSPTCNKPDFMQGGAYGQAMTDIAGDVVGGGSQLCQLADSQDESLVQFYGEVLAMSFFVSSGPSPKMLPVPWVLLGARSYMQRLTGESVPGHTCGHILETNWLNDGIPEATAQVPLNGNTVSVPASSFVAVASRCSAADANGKCSLGQLQNNNCDVQRRHLEGDVRLWYQAFEAQNYPPAVQQAFAGVVISVGTGPWGAGVWYGDSQQYFLAVWLATSLLSSGNNLDYYLYDHFCENPANQCFVLGAAGCSSCIASSGEHSVNAGRCGSASVQDMIQMYAGQPALALYNTLKDVGAPPSQVFDLLKPLQGQLASHLQPPPSAPQVPPGGSPAVPPPGVPPPVFPPPGGVAPPPQGGSVYPPQGGVTYPGYQQPVGPLQDPRKRMVLAALGVLAVFGCVIAVVGALCAMQSRQQYQPMMGPAGQSRSIGPQAMSPQYGQRFPGRG